MWQDIVNLLNRLGLMKPMEELSVRLTGYSIAARMITWNEGVPYINSLMLRTVGVKSGDLRDAVLFYFADGDSWIIIGSVGGGPKHPGWVHNLRANPHAWVFVDRKRHPVEAEFLDAGPQLFGQFVRSGPVGAEFCRLFGDVRFCHRQRPFLE